MDDVVESSGLKIFNQQTGTPGKIRTVIEKKFEKDIGTKGEKILKVILDQTGRIVTAYPAEKLTKLGLGIMAIQAVDANAESAADATKRKYESRMKEADEHALDDELNDLSLSTINPLLGGELNSGEQEWIEHNKTIRAYTNRTVEQVESAEGRKLTSEERQEIRNVIEASVGITLSLVEDDSAKPKPNDHRPSHPPTGIISPPPE